jgi:hypothetical protein
LCYFLPTRCNMSLLDPKCFLRTMRWKLPCSTNGEKINTCRILVGTAELFNSYSGVHTGSTRHVGHFWPTVPAPGDCEDGELGGMKIGSGNRSTLRNPTLAPLCPPQIPFDQNRARTRTAVVGSPPLTAWAMARPGKTRRKATSTKIKT